MNTLNYPILLLMEGEEEYRLLLKKQRPDLNFTQNKQEASIVIANPQLAANSIDHFPNLQWIQSIYAGVEPLVQKGLRRDYLLTNAKGMFGQLISEYVLGYLIAYFRHFEEYHQQQVHHQWQPHLYQPIAGKTMVILGTGSIGSHLAQTGKTLGLDVIGVNRSGLPPQTQAFSKIFPISEIKTALQKADILVCTLPHTPETEGLLNSDNLQMCNQALLFNVGRGKTLKEKDLLAAIKNGFVQHAFLDVFQQEPLAESHPFWKHPNITITPHIAAISFPEQLVDLFVRNLDHWIHHEPLENLIDFNKGY